MIKLKNILINSPFRRLIEQRGDEQQKKLNVLFVFLTDGYSFQKSSKRTMVFIILSSLILSVIEFV